MEVLVFHRSEDKFSKKQKDSLSPVREEGFEKVVKATPLRIGLSNLKFELQKSKKGLIITFTAKLNETSLIKQRVSLPMNPWTHVNLYYHPSVGKIQIVDATVINPTRAHVENTPANYLARMVVTDTEALVYLRGRMPNIAGFKNIIVGDNEDSASAFARYSSKVKHFIEENSQRQRELSGIDIYKQISYLEAQVDVLTKIILESGIVKDEDLKVILSVASRFSMCENSNPQILMKKLQYKKVVRGTDGVC